MLDGIYIARRFMPEGLSYPPTGKLSERILEWTNQIKEHRSRPHWQTCRMAGKRLLKFLGDKTFSDITRQDIQKFLTHLYKDEKLKKGTIVLYKDSLHGMFSYYIYQDRLKPSNPCNGLIVKLPNPDQTPSCSRSDLQKLIAAAARANLYYWSYAIPTGYHTGMRLGDLCLMERDFIDWTQETITFLPAKTRKTKKYCVIPIEKHELYPILRAQFDRPIEPKWQYASKYVCPELAMRYKMDEVNTRNGRLTHEFKVIARAAGLPHLSSRSLRHSFISRTINSGADRQVVSKMTGHTQMKTMDKYMHVSLDALRKTIDTAAQNQP